MTELENNDFLRLLFSRLLWPVPLVRLRTAQEIARLVENEPTRSATVRFFVSFLSERTLESECSALLQIIDSWALHPYFDQREIGENTNAHSLETFRILGEWPTGAEVAISFSRSHSGTVQPSHEPSKLFIEYYKTGIPLIFESELRKLQKKYGFPFFGQWAFEWEVLQNAHHFGYVGTVSYFLNPSWRDRQAQLDVMQHELLLSAYLRTFSCAVDEWDMPINYASFYTAFALRVNKKLSRIQPSKIENRYLELEEFSADKIPEEIARFCSITLFCLSGSLRVLSWSAPLFEASENRFRTVEGHTYLCEGTDLDLAESAVEDLLANRGIATAHDPNWASGELDSEEINKHAYKHGKNQIIPACLLTYPIHAGRWLQDYFAHGFNFPASYLFGQTPLSLAEDGGGLTLNAAGQRVGLWKCWHRNWSQSHHIGGRSNIGSETLISNEAFENYISDNDLHVYYVIQIEDWSRERSYDEFTHTRASFFLKQAT